MNDFFRIMSHLAGIVGCIIAIYLLCRLCPTKAVDFDYAGTLVSILALLVPFLVAWNIYSAIGVEKKVEDIRLRQNGQAQRLERRFEELQSNVNAQIESIQNQFDQMRERAESDKQAYIAQFNAVQGQISVVNNDKDYLQQYSHFQTALNALLKCTYFPSDIRHNIYTLLKMMEDSLENIPEKCEDIDEYCNLYDEERKEFLYEMEEISKSPRKEFSFKHRQKFIEIASKAKKLFDKKYNSAKP